MDVNYRYTDYLRGAEKPSMEQSVSLSCPFCSNRLFTSEKRRQQHIDRNHKDTQQERDREREKDRERERERQRKSTGSPEAQLAQSLENQTTAQP